MPRRVGAALADSDQHPLDNISINVSPPQHGQYRKFISRKQSEKSINTDILKHNQYQRVSIGVNNSVLPYQSPVRQRGSLPNNSDSNVNEGRISRVSSGKKTSLRVVSLPPTSQSSIRESQSGVPRHLRQSNSLGGEPNSGIITSNMP